jgi:hypothetical protein
LIRGEDPASGAVTDPIIDRMLNYPGARQLLPGF